MMSHEMPAEMLGATGNGCFPMCRLQALHDNQIVINWKHIGILNIRNLSFSKSLHEHGGHTYKDNCFVLFPEGLSLGLYSGQTQSLRLHTRRHKYLSHPTGSFVRRTPFLEALQGHLRRCICAVRKGQYNNTYTAYRKSRCTSPLRSTRPRKSFRAVAISILLPERRRA